LKTRKMMSLRIGPLTQNTLKMPVGRRGNWSNWSRSVFWRSTSLICLSLQILCSVASTWRSVYEALHICRFQKANWSFLCPHWTDNHTL
jgi:hypothetical protein